MSDGFGDRQAWVEQMTSILGPDFVRFRMLDEAGARAWAARREALFRRGQELGLGCYDGSCINLYTRELSPGCRRCKEGTWSCIFLNGRCNRACFFCPQKLNHEAKNRPVTEAGFNRTFEGTDDYMAFLRALGYRGMSVSGGEPFLTFDRMIEYISRTRAEFGSEMYLWAYTNGSLYTHERGELLRDAGLDELRFDIAANDYDLGAITDAARTIPAVTVEIPAIPEDQARLLALLPALAKIGVSFLNLHQLYVTPNNCAGLADRGYTVARSNYPIPTVIESEICALEVMCHALEARIPIAINYCSHAYKTRCQTGGHQARLVEAITREGPRPELGAATRTGMMRQIAVGGSPAERGTVAERLRALGVAHDRYAYDEGCDTLYITPDLLGHRSLGRQPVCARYFYYQIAADRCECTHDGNPISGGTCTDRVRIDGFNATLERIGPFTQIDLPDEPSRLAFAKLFVDEWPVARTIQHLAGRGFAGAKKRERLENDVRRLHHGAMGLEYVNPYFPPYS